VWKKCILKGIWQPRWLWWLLVALSTLCWLAVHIWKRVTGSGPPTFRQRNAIQCNANRCKAISIWSYFHRWAVEVNVHMYFSLGGAGNCQWAWQAGLLSTHGVLTVCQTLFRCRCSCLICRPRRPRSAGFCSSSRFWCWICYSTEKNGNKPCPYC